MNSIVMPNFLSKKYLPYYLLGFILVLAFFLRVWGLDYGLPYFLIGDERAQVYGALKMGALKTLIPAFYPAEFKMLYYPPLMSYVYLVFLIPVVLIQYLIGSFASFGELVNHFILDPTFPWLVARLVSALIGVATIYLIYLIGRKVFNHSVGIISALFLTLSFLHIQLSHFTRAWIPIVFFNCLVILLSFDIYKTPQRKYYLWIGLASGLAFGASYTTSLSLIIFLTAHFLSSESDFRKKLKDKNLWTALFVFGVLSLIFLLLHPEELLRFTIGGGSGGGSNVLVSMMTSKSLAGYLSSFVYYGKTFVFYEPVIALFSLLGIILLWLKSKRIFFAFLFWPFSYISLLYFLFHHETRYLALILPWFILLSSYTLYHLVSKLLERVKKPFLIRTLILILVFIYPLTIAVRYDYLLSKKDTRILAKNWIEENIPAQAKIISNLGGINPVATKESILFQEEFDESSLRSQDRILLNIDNEKYPKPAYNVFKLAYLQKGKAPTDLVQFIENQEYQYFLIYFWDESYLSREIRLITQKAQLVQEFKPNQSEKTERIHSNFLQPISILFSLENLGPIVKIYKL